jgi:hypothetical protein
VELFSARSGTIAHKSKKRNYGSHPLHMILWCAQISAKRYKNGHYVQHTDEFPWQIMGMFGRAILCKFRSFFYIERNQYASNLKNIMCGRNTTKSVYNCTMDTLNSCSLHGTLYGVQDHRNGIRQWPRCFRVARRRKRKAIVWSVRTRISIEGSLTFYNQFVTTIRSTWLKGRPQQR